MPFLAEAMRLFEEGTGSAEDIDTGARVGLNHPMGPLELADFIGLDVCLGIMEVLADGLGGEQFQPPAVLRELVAAGHLGQKTGQGFYTYPRQERTLALPKQARQDCPWTEDRAAGAAAERRTDQAIMRRAQAARQGSGDGRRCVRVCCRARFEGPGCTRSSASGTGAVTV